MSKAKVLYQDDEVWNN